MNAAIAASDGRGEGSLSIPSAIGRPQSGGLVSLGFQRISNVVSVSLEGTLASPGYRDIAAVNDAPEPSSTLTASIGYQIGEFGDIGVAYLRQRWSGQQNGPSLTGVTNGIVANPQGNLATASYSVPIAGRFTFYSTAYDDLEKSHNFGLGFGVSFQLGQTTSASVGATMQDGHYSSAADVEKPAVEEGDFGYQVQDQEGSAESRIALGEYLSRWGEVSAGVSDTPAGLAERVGATGSVAWVGGGVFPAPRINDSFAVITTGDVADVPVLYENRLIGTTDSDGLLLVPYLLSYQNNKIALDITRLPVDVDVGQTAKVIRPPDHSGVVVDFDVHKVHAALLKLVDTKGVAVPVGSIARLKGSPDKPFGFDGEAYLTGLMPKNDVKVLLPDGSQCSAHFDYKAVTGDIPVIGPIPCQ